MGALEVLNGSRTAQVEEVLARAPVSRVGSFASSDVSEGVLDGGSFAQRFASSAGLLQSAELFLTSFVDGDRYRSAPS
jgi:hypothetical protein